MSVSVVMFTRGCL